MERNQFDDVMGKQTDSKLVEILKNKNDYQSAAIEAAVRVAVKRNIIKGAEDIKSGIYNSDHLSEEYAQEISESDLRIDQDMQNMPDWKLEEIMKNRRTYKPLIVDAAISEAVSRKMITDIDELESKYPSFSSEESWDYVNESADDERSKEDMTMGAIICVSGIIVTGISYSIASPGGVFVVTWGAIGYGAIRFFKGLMA